MLQAVNYDHPETVSFDSLYYNVLHVFHKQFAFRKWDCLVSTLYRVHNVNSSYSVYSVPIVHIVHSVHSVDSSMDIIIYIYIAG